VLKFKLGIYESIHDDFKIATFLWIIHVK